MGSRSTLLQMKDNSALKKKTEKDIQRIRHDVTKKANIRNKGRIIGGQSKQGHSSVYEYMNRASLTSCYSL
jgi:hypothetical protein